MLAMQGVGYGIIMPLYGAIHLLISPTAVSEPSKLPQQVQTLEDPGLYTLPWSTVVGYILPSILMSLPIFSPVTHQYLVAAWQFFPLWVFFLQLFFGWAHRYLNTETRPKPHWTPGHSHATELMALHRAYIFAFTTSTLTQLSSILLVACFKTTPRPMSYRKIFLPPNFRSRAQIKDMVQGAHNFLQYDQYVGSLAAVTWAAMLHYNTRGRSLTKRQWLWLAFEICGVSIISGPAGALVTLMWNRDEYVMEADAGSTILTNSVSTGSKESGLKRE